MFECWLLDFADIVLRTVFWVSTSFLINSSFVQRFFFIRDIYFLPRIFLAGLLGYCWQVYWNIQKKNQFFYLRGLIQNSQIYLTHKFSALIFKNSSMLETDKETRWFSVMGVWIPLVIGIIVSSDVSCWPIVDISFVLHVVISVSSDNLSKLPMTNFLWSECYAGIAQYCLT